ncbi:MAG: helix-hairpin-helix domain-containing protein [Atopobiaceae bacterium]
MAQRRLQGQGRPGLRDRVRHLNLGNRKAACALIAAGSAVALFLAVAAAFSHPAFTVEKGAQDAASSEQAAAQATDDSSSDKTEEKASEKAADPVLVDIDGAVAHPGVYDLAGTTERVKDAVAAAGGLLDDADTAQLNLAQAVTDGTKIHVPKAGETDASSAPSQATSSGTSAASGSSSSSTSSSSTSASSSGLVNINTATAEELETLPGVGASTANAIIQDRQEHGAFSSKEDLMRVSGIGEKKYAKLEANICV